MGACMAVTEVYMGEYMEGTEVYQVAFTEAVTAVMEASGVM